MTAPAAPRLGSKEHVQKERHLKNDKAEKEAPKKKRPAKIETRLEIYEQIQRDRSETHGTEQTKRYTYNRNNPRSKNRKMGKQKTNRAEKKKRKTQVKV